MPGPVLAVIDVMVVLAMSVLVLRWWTRSAAAPRTWLVVLGATTSYVLYANVLTRFVPFTISAYILILCTMLWDLSTGYGTRSTRPLQAYGGILLLLVSWIILSLIPAVVALLLSLVGSRRLRAPSGGRPDPK
jgi:hypothetical protein